MIDHDKIKREMNKEPSNIAFNIRTKQFGVILWKRENTAKINNCGTWGDEEYQILTIGQAMNLIDFNHNNSSWNSPSKECINAVFGDDIIINDIVLLKFKEDDFTPEDLGMSGHVLTSPFTDLKTDWENKERFIVIGSLVTNKNMMVIKRELGKKISIVPKEHLTRLIDEYIKN